jgi:hypothetical protein
VFGCFLGKLAENAIGFVENNIFIYRSHLSIVNSQ